MSPTIVRYSERYLEGPDIVLKPCLTATTSDVYVCCGTAPEQEDATAQLRYRYVVMYDKAVHQAAHLAVGPLRVCRMSTFSFFRTLHAAKHVKHPRPVISPLLGPAPPTRQNTPSSSPAPTAP
jgi:hypothetical protein